MSKSIRSYPRNQRESVIERRLKGSSRGLGYWAAVEANKILWGEKK